MNLISYVYYAWRTMIYATTLIISLVCFALATDAWAANETESQLKAAFTLNFLKFTSFSGKVFPAEVRLCLPSDSEFFEYFKSIDQKVIGKSLVLVREVAIDQLKNCDVVFLPADSREAACINSVKDMQILTIGESDTFLEQGGMIQFVLQDGKMKFRISIANATAQGIRFSSKLLRIAEVIGE